MFDFLLATPLWQGLGTSAAWVVTVCLLVAGLVGCILPVLPGHLLIFIGVLAHWLMLGPDSGLRWWSLAIQILLMAISQTFEFLSGAAGAKWFGGTKWGAAGAVVGSLVGLFFLPFGLLLGPLIGAFAFELMFAKKQTTAAVNSGIGSVVGTLAGMVIKIAIGVLMIAWFFIDVFFIA